MPLIPLNTRALSADWHFRALDPATGLGPLLQGNDDAAAQWLPAQVPGTVQQDLLALGRIPDHAIACQEQQVQWVGERDWVYRLHFDADDLPQGRQTELVFDGLDTFAEVWLNGCSLLRSDNMFVPARVPLHQHLKPRGNVLLIVFESALRRGREREAMFGPRHLWNGDASRLYVRKAGFHYGWDWGPVLMTAGPWQPVSLQVWDLRLAEVDSRTWLSPSLDAARVDVHASVAGLQGLSASERAGLRVVLRLDDPQGQAVAQASMPCDVAFDPACDLTRVEGSLPVPQPQLWWPRTQGAQPLYTLVTELHDAQGRVLHTEQRRLGLRRIRLLQEPVAGEPGRSFHFEVNGRPLFMGGANWIPDDNLLNRITPERYRQRVQQAADANMPMLRVWGGGIYESEAFYDACDELGVLVWQDFLFACGMYPAHPDFLASVEAEADAAVRRLRHRACLAIWCGNNEDYAVAESIGQYGVGKDMARFEGRVIYEQLLPRVCATLDPQRPYWPGSPYSPSATSTLGSADPTVGDRHTWEVWHVNMLPYQQYQQVQGRFVSEFGMQSHPSLALLERVIPSDELYPNSRALGWHNKAGSGTPDGHRRLAVYMADNLRVPDTLAGQVYATQFVQAEAMRYAYQDFRTRWQRDGARAVGGALVWQLNDCWPVTSWAIIDSDGVPKPAWHTIRRALAPLAVSLRLHDGVANAVVMSDRPRAVQGTLSLELFRLDGTPLGHQQHAVEAPANGSLTLRLALPECADQARQPAVGVLRFAPLDGGHAARDVAWPEPFRFHPLQAAALELARDEVAGCLWLRTQRPTKGVWLQASGLEFKDNFIDLVPGESVRVDVTGDLRKLVRVWALDQDERWL